MDKVFEPDLNFDFTKLSLGHPQTTKGGSYFTKILFDNQSVYVQFPKCKTKQGVVQTEKNIYADLLYETSYNNELNEWLENLENNCQKLLYEKNNLWFSGDIELNDIESAFTNSAKMYKSGKQFLIRCYIPKPQIIKTSASCFVYDESEKPLPLNDIDVSREIIPLVKIDGIKFTSKSFQLELILTQIMVMNYQDDFKHCLIKPSTCKPAIQSTLSSNLIQSNGEKLTENYNLSDPNLDINKKDESIIRDEQQMAVSISFPETNDLDLESTNVIDDLHISDNEDEGECEEDEDEGEEDDYEDEEDDDDDDNEGEGEGEEDEDEDEDEGEDVIKTNLKGGENKVLRNDLVEIDNLEIVDNANIFQKNENMKRLLRNSIEARSSGLDTNSLTKINSISDLEEIKNNNALELVDLNIDNQCDSIKLRKPNEVYYEIYKAAREKAKRAKKNATEAYLEAKNIKIKYMLDDLDESDEDEVYSENN